MVKVKKCLDAGCTEYILLEDGRAIVQPKDECSIEHVAKDFEKQFADIVKETTETIYTSKHLFNVEEGDEVFSERMKEKKKSK